MGDTSRATNAIMQNLNTLFLVALCATVVTSLPADISHDSFDATEIIPESDLSEEGVDVRSKETFTKGGLNEAQRSDRAKKLWEQGPEGKRESAERERHVQTTVDPANQGRIMCRHARHSSKGKPSACEAWLACDCELKITPKDRKTSPKIPNSELYGRHFGLFGLRRFRPPSTRRRRSSMPTTPPPTCTKDGKTEEEKCRKGVTESYTGPKRADTLGYGTYVSWHKYCC